MAPKQAERLMIDTIQDRPVFTFRHDADGNCIFKIDENMSIRERTLQSHRLPEILNAQRLLTEAELKENGWMHLKADTPYFIEAAPNVIRKCAYRFSAAKLKEIGLLDLMGENRAKLLHPDLQPKLYQLMVKATGQKFTDNKGTVYEPGISIQPTCGVSSYQLSPLSRHPEDWDGYKRIQEMMTIAHTALMHAFPELEDEARELRVDTVAPFTIGKADNNQLTSIQMNYTLPEQSLKEAIGARFADIHPDMHDNATLFTALVSYSNFDENYFGGRMNITPLRLTCPLKPMEIIIFSARYFHCATGLGPYSVPEGSLLRHPASTFTNLPELPAGTPKMRLNLSIYPDERLFDLKLGRLNEELFSDDALVLRESKRQHYEWMARYFITHEPTIRKFIKVREDLTDQYGNMDAIVDAENNIGRALVGKGPEILRIISTTMKTEYYKEKADEVAGHKAAVAAALAAGQTPPPKQKFKSKKRKVRGDEDESEGAARNGRVDFYQRLFAWDDDKESGEMHYPTEDKIQKSLDAVGKENPGFAQLLREIESLNCGTRVGKSKAEMAAEKAAKEAGQPKKSDVLWINQDYNREFNVEEDVVLA